MNAVATLLFSPNYLPGALVLGHVLRRIVDQNTKLVILIDASAFTPLHLHLLHQLWDEVRDTQVYQSQLHHKLIHDLQRPELAATFTKIQLWDLPYEKVLYLDADTLPLVGSTNVTDLLKLDFPAGKILAAPDSGFPDIFNSGVFALRPNQHDYLNLLSLVMSNNKDISFDGADQGLLNQYFNSDPDWVAQALQTGAVETTLGQFSQSSNWIKIPFLYNTTPNTQYQYAPAFNHFQSSEEPSSQIHRIGDSNVKDTPGSSTDTPESSGAIAQAAYHATAFEHFTAMQAGNQVKLIHFIGPVKPWKSDPVGLFESWWKEWFDYSGGKLLYETLYRQFYQISVTALNIPGQTTEPSSSTTEQLFSFEQPKVQEFVPEKKAFEPADLCDPMNYQQFVSQPTSSHIAWDATREQPPLEKPDLGSFDADIRAFNSSWEEPKHDEPPHQEQEHYEPAIEYVEPEHISEYVAEIVEEQVQEQPPALETLIISKEEPQEWNEPVPEPMEDFGYHKDQQPERSFDDSYDYTPTHYLLEKQKEADAAAMEQVIEIEEDAEIDEAEEDFVEAETEVEIEVPEETFEPEENTGCQKLFPWEFREARASTRSWD